MKTNSAISLLQGWEYKNLGEVVEILDGDRGSNYPNGADFSDNGFCLFLNTKNVPNTKFSFSERMFITEEKDKLLRKGKLRRGDYVMTTRGTIGNFAYYNKTVPFDHVRINSGMVILRADKNNVDEVFFGQYLNSMLFRHQFTSLQSGSAVPQLPIRDIKTFSILLPPLPEQRAIADMLSSLDAKIELLREQNEILERTAKTIFQEWFGRYSVESPEELPEGWRVGKIMEIIKREPVSYKCDKNDLDVKGNTPIMDQGVTGLYGYSSREPDFIASNEKPVIIFTNHTCNYWFVDYPFCAIQNVLPYRGKNGYDEYFLYFMTKGSITFIEYKGHWPDFEAKDFIIPPVEKAGEFSKIAKPILKKISSNKYQIQSLSKTRDTLLPKLMSGEVRVV